MLFLSLTKDQTNMYKWLVFGILFVILIMIAIGMAYSNLNKKMSKKNRIRIMSCISIFSALSIGLYFLKFNLPFIFPEFLEIQFSALPGIIIGFLLGPIEGVTVILVKTILKVPFSSTMGVGELADLLIGIVTVLVSSFFYRRTHNKKGGLLGLTFGGIAWVITAFIANLVILVPFYIALFFNGNVQSFVNMCMIIPGINQQNYMIRYLLLTVIPFNTLLAFVCMFATYILYKRISFLFHRFDEDENEEIVKSN